MARIYISSTYSDLVAAREAVHGALRKMQHQVVAMEDYVAADQRPLDKCLADVAACDIYVGIFAWRYGYVPPNQVRSITELEFRQAQESRKPCLLFLLHEEAPWPRKLLDRNLDPIEGLRAELARDYLVSFFRTPDDLAAAVSVSVVSLEKASPRGGNGGPINEGQLLELVSKLAKQCDELLKERKESDEKAYEDFIESALADFEKVHQNYLESFQGYRRMVDGQSGSHTLEHPVLKKLDEDMLFTTQLRLKLEALSEFQQDPLFGPFIKKIVEYTQGSELSKKVLLTGRRGLNVSRNYTIVGLKEIFEKEIADSQKQTEALALLDRVVSELQFVYGRVLDEHMKVKKRLFDRRRE